MFRSIKPRAASVQARLSPTVFSRNAFSRSASPLRLNAQRYAGLAPSIQAVRFRKPSLKPRNLAITAFIAYVCLQVYDKLVTLPLAKAVEKAAKHLPKKIPKEASKALFIPFPGSTRQLPVVPYQGTDPEFQEFIKISKDIKLMEKVRADFLEIVLYVANKDPRITNAFGKNFKARRTWLDIDFPIFPPPSFERLGIEISDHTISLVAQPVDTSVVYRTQNVLWPTAIFHSSWSFVKEVAGEKLRNMAGMVGVQVEASPAQQSVDQLMPRSRNVMKGMNGQQQIPGVFQRELTGKDGPPPPQQPLGDKSKEVGDAASTRRRSLAEASFPTLLNILKSFHSSIAGALIAAKKKYLEVTMQSLMTNHIPPRGCIVLQGMVEIESDRAYLVLDVYAAWNPKEQAYHMSSMRAGLRRFQEKIQTPVVVLPERPTR